ncbi:hypothetical protein H9Q73_011502 [Fusarium xylarioides]|nr:hypothetical protein H9Q73_011502 [Fusarium xylarioides]
MDVDDQDVERACKRIRLQSPEPDDVYDNFGDFLLSDSELLPELTYDNGFSASISKPTEENKDEARLDIEGEALVAETARHVCLGTIILEATSSFLKTRQELETTVNLQECGGIVKLTTADTGAYAGILKASFPSVLLHRPSVKLSALLTAPASLRVIIFSHMEETAQIGTLLSNYDLFLQHPSPRDIEYFELEMEYFNPQFLVTPGSRMPQLEDLAIEYNESTSNASLALDDQKKGQLIGIFDTAADLSIRPTTEPSPRLQTRLKDYQLKALTVMSEKECVNLENPQCPSLWAARDASTRGHRQTLAKQFRNNDIVLTTYRTLRSEWTKKGPLFTNQWFRVVLDEGQHSYPITLPMWLTNAAHRIGNRSTQVFQAACELQSSRRWCLTGTPIVNSIDNYGALLAFIKMEPLGIKATFDHWISNPIRDSVQEGLRKLRILVEATCLRRTKSTISQALPPPTVREEKVELLPYDRALYDYFEFEAAKNAADPAENSNTGRGKNVLSLIHNLRRICNHGEDLLPASDIEAWRLQTMHISARQLPGANYSLSSYSKISPSAKEALLQASFLCERIDGQYSIKQREKAMSRFANDPCCTVMLASLGSGGEGIDLTSANHVHLLEPHWNPMVEEQAIARVHRIGQQRQVTATKYITPDSVEEYVQSIQLKKKRLIQDTWSVNDDSTGNSIDDETSRKLEQWLAQRHNVRGV